LFIFFSWYDAKINVIRKKKIGAAHARTFEAAQRNNRFFNFLRGLKRLSEIIGFLIFYAV